ncbi:hypothetical protein AVEN_170142-1 [Araneus ventricosus]|uniref:Mos1 transposase HTH domain-containing protein n=1 Tax=Araneus ventricosus TaxID=182803 RepID=A0A4Y2TS91_ARAVE|nr:hypothetical protein AVEN_260941-1 [Araneus ventricosus]GBO03102.1 hypothetical protein AVEN_170142-1 [Araneus ventricosus]
MFKIIDQPANCEIRAVINFLNARNVRPCEIYRQISESQSGPSSSDFHLFSHLKKFLAGQQFASDDEIKVSVQNWFWSPAVDFYEAGMLQLVSRYDTCLNSHGEYEFKVCRFSCNKIQMKTNC